MKIRFNHFFGKQTQLDLIAFNACLECSQEEESEALAQGWLYYSNRWYQCRSTRIKLDGGILDHSWNDRFDHKLYIANDIDEIESVYQDYLDHKGYLKNFDIQADAERTIWLQVFEKTRLVAFTKLLIFESGLVSDINAYRREIKRYGIGKAMLALEAKIASERNLDYLYIGPGYEKSSSYKADIPGFEWWTGDVWSTDLDMYRRLCMSDSHVGDLQNLSSLYQNSSKSCY